MKCIVCGKTIDRKAIRCSQHAKEHRQLHSKAYQQLPENTQLDKAYFIEALKTKTFTEIGLDLGINDNSVRKRCKCLGLPTHARVLQLIPNDKWEEVLDNYKDYEELYEEIIRNQDCCRESYSTSDIIDIYKAF